MDPTTLLTFLFRAPAEARTVELLGSWDNFRQPYAMHHDRRRGTGNWSGCFKFHNIIFDGKNLTWTKPRTGGLKQGGTYWYYYRLDDRIEVYDDAKECTANCPLLPGQVMNVIEVPIEVSDRPNRSRSASAALVDDLDSLPHLHTLEPEDKFACLDPPPISRVHLRCRSDLALGGRLEHRPASTGSNARIRLSSRGSGRLGRELEVPRNERSGDRSSHTDRRSSKSLRRSWCSTVRSIASSSDREIQDTGSSVHNEVEAESNPFWSREPACSSFRSEAATTPDEMVGQFQLRVDACHDENVDEFGWAGRDTCIASGSVIGHGATFGHDVSSNYTPATRDWIRPHTSYQPCTSPAERERQRPRLFSSPSRLVHGFHRVKFSPQHTSDSELDASDVFFSPTFTATTISSNGGGLNTPFRLSDTHTTSIAPAVPDDNSIENVAEQLRSLDPTDNRSPAPRLGVREPPSSFMMYSLPSADTTQSTLTAGKLSSELSDVEGMLPSIAMPETRHDSFAELVFSELNL